MNHEQGLFWDHLYVGQRFMWGTSVVMSAIGQLQEGGTGDIPLNWDVFVTPGIPTVTSDLPRMTSASIPIAIHN
jgi:hypothetical protein